MILADTSVWVDHLRAGNRRLAAWLRDGQVAAHPFVIGELACGRLRDRDTVLDLLQRLPPAAVATHGEALTLLQSSRLWGSGLGWVDVHLLASARLSAFPLWTLDRPLHLAARRLGCAVPG